MKKLIILNIISALALCAVMIAFQRSEDGILMLFAMGLLLLFLALAAGNLAAIFQFWKRYRVRAFLPAASYALAMALLLVGGRVSSRMTPCSPDSFLDAQTRKNLAEVAQCLLGQSIKEICTYPDKPMEIEMISKPEKQLPPRIEKTLRTYGFYRTRVDDSLSLVVFCHYRLRTWHEYLYTTNKLPPLYSRPVAFTEIDIEDWSELLRIAKQGPNSTDDERRCIAFIPCIAYPYFQRTLGENVLTRLQSYTSSAQVSPEEKVLVLDALNQQRRLTNRLAEDAAVTFEGGMFPLHLGEQKISDGFWVTSLIKQLLDRGILLHASDGRHLKIKPNPSPEEMLNLEWVHVGLMNFVYGNLVQKREYAYTRSLGDGWYYNRW